MVLAQARNDESFLKQFQDKPEETLVSAGIDADAARHIVTQELNFSGDEVSGYARCQMTCDRWTCAATWCSYVPITA